MKWRKYTILHKTLSFKQEDAVVILRLMTDEWTKWQKKQPYDASYKINLSKMKQTKQFITQLILLYNHQLIFFNLMHNCYNAYMSFIDRLELTTLTTMQWEPYQHCHCHRFHTTVVLKFSCLDLWCACDLKDHTYILFLKTSFFSKVSCSYKRKCRGVKLLRVLIMIVTLHNTYCHLCPSRYHEVPQGLTPDKGLIIAIDSC